ncbi:hypothetical protein A2976_02120 [candidate division WWE3 bacterium RIFCSPLOWO2_01_FULL_41_9]|uniref:EfeO-type cupredoxin-like domain-containing protein n=1 Tax=candidate division WWE3 bacterium RIFCSPLOWO2_01_FULL_41_9 TaxID=1802626 RepID=A0A1F4VKR9_UNCKA|nr:MAG: hypothetical protein A2976_02120 [candidate division WWE3 bacterium RIFCSPLOWO2_01_FULL_41_9]
MVNVIVIILIIGTYVFFFMKKESKAVAVGNQVEIMVSGGYKPDVIRVKKGSPVTLKFNRKDPSSCLEELVIPDFGKNIKLALGEITSVEITPSEPGEFQFHCGMNMYHGRILVEN